MRFGLCFTLCVLVGLMVLGQTRVYVANQLSNTITIINANDNAVLGTLAPFNMPSNLAFTPDGTKGVVTFAGNGTASIIDPNDPFNFTNLTCGAGASDVVISPDGTKAYVGNASAGTISVIDLIQKAVVATFNGGGNGVAISPDGTTLYSTNKSAATVVRFNTATGVPTTLATGIVSGGRLALSHDGQLLCVVQNLLNQVTFLKTSNGNIEASVPVGLFPTSASFTADDQRALVTNTAGNSVSVIDLDAFMVETTLSVTGGPIDIAVVPSVNKAFTANNSAGSSTPIDLNTLTTQSEITCGSFPIAVSFAGEGFTATNDQHSTNKWKVSQPYPNPVTDHTSFNVTLEE